MNILSDAKIAIIGETLIDEYYSIEVNRISPEFPIPVELCSGKPSSVYPGGAGNLALQLIPYCSNAHFYSVLDEYALKIVNSFGINTENSVIGDIQIPIKQRYYAGENPVSRRDIEVKNDLLKYEQILLENFKQNSYDIVIFSDYNKGLFSLHSEWMKSPGFKIVDPKKGPISKWKGCNLFKPNSTEANELSPYSDWISQCKYFNDQLNCSVVITRGGLGVCGIDEMKFHTNPYFHYSPKNKDSNLLKSYQGAGDCFLAFLALCLNKYSLFEACKIAYSAGKIYVHKPRNESITLRELTEEIDPQSAPFIKPEKKGKVVFVNGCFDILHSAHIDLLNFAKSQGDMLIVALNSDSSIKRLKGDKRPINCLKDRMKMLANIKCVDYVISFEEDTPYNLIKELKPDIIIKGGDYTKDTVVGNNLAEIIIFPYKPGVSTTQTILRHQLCNE